jgi:hypothetical protein
MKKSTIIIGIAIIVVILYLLREPIDKAMTRGYKNNNPGNIRKTASKWKGEIDGKDPDFKTFSTMAWGYRALAALLKEYINAGYNTINSIINRYAPGNENNTQAYINTVVKKTNLKPDETLFIEEQKIKKLMAAISYVENGIEPDNTDIEAGIKLLQG